MESAAQRMLDMPLNRQFIAFTLMAIAAGWWDGDWALSAAILSLWLIWAIVPVIDGPPVLALALTFQWMQCTIGLFYVAMTGRPLGTIYNEGYRDFVMISLGCVIALAIGLRLGVAYMLRGQQAAEDEPSLKVGLILILGSYALPLLAEPTLIELAFTYTGIGQAIFALRFIRLAALYLILRRCVADGRWSLFGAVVLLELGLGFTSFYAGFREPLVIAIAAISERFHPRNLAQALSLLLVIVMGSLLGLAWLGVRRTYRADFDSDLIEQTRGARASRLGALGSDFFRRDRAALLDSTDDLVDRLWAIRYPSLAYSRVPSVLPHTDGAILSAALQHVFTPRILFPNKPGLESDSEMVRKYSGIWVAGQEQETSIAFGYVIESYIDYGIPYMFLPSLGWGVFLGLAFGWLALHIKTRELRIGLLMVVFWLALYLFERSWARTMGNSGTALIYLGLPAVLLDRLLFRRAQDRLSESVVVGLDSEAPSQTPATR